MPSEQIVVSLDNEPGTLANACETIAEADVNVEGLSLETNGPFGTLRFVSDDNAKALKVLENDGFHVTKRPVTTVRLPNEPGQLADAARRLGDSGINIENVFANVPGGEEAEIVLDTDDPTGADKVLQG